MRKLLLIFAFLFFAAEIGADRCAGQSWSNILSPSRAIDWSTAGLPNPLPDGEATANPWTPPSRTQCGPTLTPSGGDDASQINGAVAGTGTGFTSCNPPYMVMLGAGTFQVNSTLRLGGSYTNGHNNVTVRGSGPMSTIVAMGSAGAIFVGAIAADAGRGDFTNTASNFTQGQTSFTIENVTGTGELTAANMNAGKTMGQIMQCNDGFTGPRPLAEASSCTGSPADTLGVYICTGNAVCAINPEPDNNMRQWQLVWIKNAVNNGNGTWTITTDPPLRMPNYTFAKGTSISWCTAQFSASGMGLEDMTIQMFESASGGNGIDVGDGTANWMKGVRMIGYNNNAMFSMQRCWRCLVANNYFFGHGNGASLGNTSLGVIFVAGMDVGTLLMNNIGDMSWFSDDGSGQGGHLGLVMGYNYARDTFTGHYQPPVAEHRNGAHYTLREGNQFGGIIDDNTHASHHFQTNFRNSIDCGDFPFQIPGQTGGGLAGGGWDRFSNNIGNIVGFVVPQTYRANKCDDYFGTGPGGEDFALNGFAVPDPSGLTQASAYRWGNYAACSTDSTSGGSFGTHCNKVSFDPAEDPTNMSTWPNAVPYQNISNPSQNLPCSFFLAGFTSTTCTPKYSGGTGLNWWKVCDSWTTFPTTCSHYTTPPFPPIGPDILIANGAPANYANDIPAAVAWKKLPIDTSFQNSYTVTGSSWSSTNGGIETLTVSALPTGEYTMGGFQLQGAPNSCFPNSTPQELLMEASTTTTVSYLLPGASGPATGACNGTMKWPDVRQFDQRVYASDPSGTTGAKPNPPTGLSATVQ